jgi:hypothetical protein
MTQTLKKAEEGHNKGESTASLFIDLAWVKGISSLLWE